MFRITECELTVKDGSMSAVMTMGGTGYLKLYMGTGRKPKRLLIRILSLMWRQRTEYIHLRCLWQPWIRR